MEKVYKNVPVIDKNGDFGLEQVELDTIKTVITELTNPQLEYLLAIVQFQQRLNKLFFDDEDKYEAFQSEADKALKEYQKTREPKEADLKKCERVVARALEDHCGINGKSLVFEIARRLCKGQDPRMVVNWTFSINEVYEDGTYDWMF